MTPEDVLLAGTVGYKPPPPETPQPKPITAPDSSLYDPIIEKHAAANGIDPDLVRAVMGTESRRSSTAVSPKGARGLLQLMPGTAARFNVKDVNNPDENIRGGTEYLKYLSDRYNGDPDKVLAAYNAGEGRVDHYGGIPPFAETRAYVPATKDRYQRLTGRAITTTRAGGKVSSLTSPDDVLAAGTLQSPQKPDEQVVVQTPKGPMRVKKATADALDELDKYPQIAAAQQEVDQKAAGVESTQAALLAGARGGPPTTPEDVLLAGTVQNPTIPPGQTRSLTGAVPAEPVTPGTQAQSDTAERPAILTDTNRAAITRPRTVGEQAPVTAPEIQQPADTTAQPNDMEFGGMSPAEKAAYGEAQARPNQIDDVNAQAMALMSAQHRADLQRKQLQQKLNTEDYTVRNAVKNPEKLAADIKWHFGDAAVQGMSSLPPAQQRKMILIATAAARRDAGKSVPVPTPDQQAKLQERVPGLANAIQSVSSNIPGTSGSGNFRMAEDRAMKAAGMSQGNVRMYEGAEQQASRDADIIRTELARQGPGLPSLPQRLKDAGITDPLAAVHRIQAAQSPAPQISVMATPEQNAAELKRFREVSRAQIQQAAQLASETEVANMRSQQPGAIRTMMRALSPAFLISDTAAGKVATGETGPKVVGELADTFGDLLHFVDTGAGTVKGNDYVATAIDKIRDFGAYMRGRGDIAPQGAGEQFLKSGAGMLGAAEKYELEKGATGLPFWALMGGEAVLQTQGQPVHVQALKTAENVLFGAALEFGPGVISKTLGKMPGVVGELARKMPTTIGVATTSTGFGGLAAYQVYKNGGTPAEVIGAGLGAAGGAAALSVTALGKEAAGVGVRAENTPEWLRSKLAKYTDVSNVVMHTDDGRAMSVYGNPKSQGIGGEEIPFENVDKYTDAPKVRVTPEQFAELQRIIKSGRTPSTRTEQPLIEGKTGETAPAEQPITENPPPATVIRPQRDGIDPWIVQHPDGTREAVNTEREANDRVQELNAAPKGQTNAVDTRQQSQNDQQQYPGTSPGQDLRPNQPEVRSGEGEQAGGSDRAELGGGSRGTVPAGGGKRPTTEDNAPAISQPDARHGQTNAPPVEAAPVTASTPKFTSEADASKYLQSIPDAEFSAYAKAVNADPTITGGQPWLDFVNNYFKQSPTGETNVPVSQVSREAGAKARKILDAYDDGDNEISTAADVVNQLEAANLLPEAVAAYREGEKISKEFGYRMDREGEVFEKEVEPQLRALAGDSSNKESAASKRIPVPQELIAKSKELDTQLTNAKTDAERAQIKSEISKVDAQIGSAMMGKPAPVSQVEAKGETTPQTSAEFHGWFKGSKVVRRNGDPLTVYHFRFGRDMSEPGEGSHFGSRNASQERAANLKGATKEGAATYPVVLSIKNPFRVKETGGRDLLNDYADALIKKGLIPPRAHPNSGIIDPDVPQLNSESEVFDILEDAGYDGIVYRNKIEDPGKDSWVPFHSSQVRSTFSPQTSGEVGKPQADPLAPQTKEPKESVSSLFDDAFAELQPQPAPRPTGTPQQLRSQLAVVGKEIKALKSAGGNPGLLQAKQTHEQAIVDAIRSATVKTAPAKPNTLPADLAGAKPRYAYGAKQFELTFASDFDRAAYITAQSKPSKQDARYLKWAQDQSGLTESQVRGHGAKVRAAIKDMARDAKPGTLRVPVTPRADPPNVTGAAKTAATEAVSGLADVVKGLGEIFKSGAKGDIAGLGPAFDEKTYEQAKPFFVAGAKHFYKAGMSLGDVMKALLKYLVDVGNFAMDQILAMRPYIERFVSDFRDGKIDLNETVDAGAHEAATSPLNDLSEPTEGQHNAENFQKGHIRMSGLDIAITHPEGSERSGRDASGKEWSRTMQSAYGDIKRTSGKDGENVDVFIKPGTPLDYQGPVFVVNQTKGNGHFDEHKTMIGWDNEVDAEKAYLANYEKGWDRYRDIAHFGSMGEFKDWLKNEDQYLPAESKGWPFQEVSANYGTIDNPNVPNLSTWFAARFGRGESYGSITQARKDASELLGGKVEAGTDAAKKIDEAVELGVVKAARQSIADDKAVSPPATEQEVYRDMVDLYSQQPNLGVKTSTSVANQAYSTPVPLAYIASRLAGIDQSTSVYEPTAGNGALLIEANPKNVTANELDKNRYQNLISLMPDADTISHEDATEFVPGGIKNRDVVIANPPFGAVKEDGETKRFQVNDRYNTPEIDHAIAMKALQAMKDDGSAVLILGGIKADSEAARSNGYAGKSKLEFYVTLYGEYNVVDHFTVNGDLYKKQGAAWPVDVVVIHGRGKSQRTLPAADVPRIYDSWDELEGVLDEPYRRKLLDARSAASQHAEPGSKRTPGDRSNQRPASDAIGLPDVSETAGRPAGSLTEPRGRSAGGAEQLAGATGRSPADRRPGRGTDNAIDNQRANEPSPGTEHPGSIATDAAAEQSGRANDLRGSDTGKLGERATESPDEPRQVKADRSIQKQDVTQTQAPYRSASQAGTKLNTLVPANMKGAIEGALDRLTERVGDVDEFIAKEVGYSTAELGDYFSAEQIDAAALAIDALKRNSGMIIGDQGGIGKGRSQPLTAKVLTPKGWRLMGEIKTGDYVCAGDGSQSEVIGVYPQGEIPIFEIEFTDGAKTQCSADHLWLAVSENQRETKRHKPESFYAQPKIVTTDEIRRNVHKGYSVPMVVAPQFDSVDVPIDPYLLGVLLGDGCLREHAVQVVVADDEILTAVRASLPLGIVAKKVKYRDWHYDLKKPTAKWKGQCKPYNALISGLRSLVLTGKTAAYKFVPDLYKFNAPDVRLAILQGLMDTDGYINKTGSSMYYSVSEQLADDMVFLVQSLGGTATRSIKKTKKLPCHVVYVKLPKGTCPFRLSRKVARVKTWTEYPPRRLIKAVRPVGKAEAQCIAIDHPSSLYVTDDFIVTHNTIAAVIKWAHNNDKPVIFVTEKPNLYKDIVRDLTDIGYGSVREWSKRAVMTNGNETVPLDDEGLAELRTRPDSHAAKLQEMINEGSLGQHDLILTTYNQMQTVKGARTLRQDFLQHFAEGSIVIFDESHNAGGAEKKDMRNKAAKALGPQLDRSVFARQLINLADGVFYSSATYAKRPQVMDLYSKTDMKLAVPKPSDLAGAIEKGGVPLQQAVAAMLAEAGQYIRRERDFAGMTYETDPVQVNHAQAESTSAVMRAIVVFDLIKSDAIQGMDKAAKAEAKKITGSSGATGKAGAESTNFTSLMHNLISQMLLMLKADGAVVQALDVLKGNEKPVITLASTMGSFIQGYAEDNDLHAGDALGLSFGDMLRRYLERSRDVRVGKAFGPSERHYLTDKELGPHGVAAYNQVIELIRAADWSGMPISPIDHIKNRLKEAGYKTGEITGRGHVVEYTSRGQVYRTRPAKETSIAGRSRTLVDFNNGTLDALIINQAGSTGLSIHASEKFKDQRRRVMLITQPELNIDTHMQMLYRVDRTGQVVKPGYRQLMADIPAEKRPAAILAKKMASLNANTTAARGSAYEAKDVPDFMNEYGDEVAASLMEDHPEINKELGRPIKPGKGQGLERDGAMRKLTGRIPLLTEPRQEELYGMIESEYADLIQRLDAMGENALEAKTLDLDAKLLKNTPIFAGTGDSPFARGAFAEESDVKRIGKPYTSEQVHTLLTTNVHGQDGETLQQLRDRGNEIATEQSQKARDLFAAYKATQVDGIEDKERAKAQEIKLNEQLARWHDVHSLLPIGEPVKISTPLGEVYGIVVKVEQKGKPRNPVTPGSWRATFAVADAMRQVTVPFSKIKIPGDESTAEESMGSSSKYAVEPSSTAQVRDKDQAKRVTVPVIDAFDLKQSESREQRTILTGNLLAAFGRFKKGRIINFTDSEGQVRQGIMMPVDFNLGKAIKEEPAVFKRAADVMAFLRAAPNSRLVTTPDSVLRLTYNHGSLRVATAASKARGGQYFLNENLMDAANDEFVKSGNTMQMFVGEDRATDVVRALLNMGAELQTDTYKDEAKKHIDRPGTIGDPGQRGSVGVAPARTGYEGQGPTAKLSELSQRIRDAYNVIRGKGPNAEPQQNFSTMGRLGEIWRSGGGFDQLAKFNRPLYEAARQAAGAGTTGDLRMRRGAQRVQEIMKTKGGWLKFVAARYHALLQGPHGKRDMWLDMRDQATNLPEEDFKEFYGGGENFDGVRGLVQVIEGMPFGKDYKLAEGFDPEDSVTGMVDALLASDDINAARNYLSNIFNAAADDVASIMPDDEYQSIINSKEFKKANPVFDEFVGDPMAATHELNDGVFSEYTGPFGYMPLVALDPKGGMLHKFVGVGRRGQEFRKPENQRNRFATGLSPFGYDISPEALAGAISRAERVNTVANMLATGEKEGIFKTLKRNEVAPDTIEYGGESFRAKTVAKGKDRIIFKDGKQIHVPAPRIAMPDFLHKELLPMLEEGDYSRGGFVKLMGLVNRFAMMGVIMPAMHIRNIQGALVAGTPYVGTNVFSKTIGNLPFTKWLNVWGNILATDPWSQSSLQDIYDMSEMGVVPSRYGKVVSGWTHKGRQYAGMTGAKREFLGLGPLIYGPAGVDIKARLLMYRAAKSFAPNGTKAEIAQFIDQLGNYNFQMHGKVEKFLKKYGIDPFYTAANTYWTNAIKATFGATPLPKNGNTVGKRMINRLAMILSGGVVGTMLLWVALHKAYTGKWPWDDPRSKLLSIPLNDKDRQHWLAQKIYGKGNDTAYVGLSFFSPLIERGARATGAEPYYNARQLGATKGQASEDAGVSILNSAAHQFVGGPVPGAIFAGVTGKRPFVTGTRDFTGREGLSFMPATRTAEPGLPTWKAHALAAATGLNSFFEQAAERTGAVNKAIGKPDKQAPPNPWLRLALDVAFPRLISNPVNLPAKRSRYVKGEKAIESDIRRDQGLPAPAKFGGAAKGIHGLKGIGGLKK